MKTEKMSKKDLASTIQIPIYRNISRDKTGKIIGELIGYQSIPEEWTRE